MTIYRKYDGMRGLNDGRSLSGSKDGSGNCRLLGSVRRWVTREQLGGASNRSGETTSRMDVAEAQSPS